LFSVFLFDDGAPLHFCEQPGHTLRIEALCENQIVT
jgi:hypothetical protein